MTSQARALCCDQSSDCRVDSATARAGFPLGHGPTISVARPRWQLREGIQGNGCWVWYRGGIVRSSLTVAERVCRTVHRIDTPRMSGPRDCLTRVGSAPSLEIILRLLRSLAHSSFVA